MKKHVLIIITTLLLSIIILGSTYKIQAAIDIDDLGEDMDAYISTDQDNTGIKPIGNLIVSVVRTVGSAISVLILVIIGIKYILGSVEEKAEYKQTMMPYIIGALLIFAGSNITNIIYKMFNP